MSEVLARLTSKSLWPTDSRGGVAELTTSEVAGLLAGLHDGAYRLALIVYCDYHKEFFRLLTAVGQIPKYPSLPDDMRGMFPSSALLELALRELFINQCKACGGTGLKHDQSKCKSCNGTGLTTFTNLSRAKITKIPVEHWKTYEISYNRLLSLLSEWNNDAERHVKLKYYERDL